MIFLLFLLLLSSYSRLYCMPSFLKVSVFFNTNEKTAINVSQARGVIVLACAKAGVPVFEYTPLQVKMAVVGYGRAEKKQVQLIYHRLSPLAGRGIIEIHQVFSVHFP